MSFSIFASKIKSKNYCTSENKFLPIRHQSDKSDPPRNLSTWKLVPDKERQLWFIKIAGTRTLYPWCPRSALYRQCHFLTLARPVSDEAVAVLAGAVEADGLVPALLVAAPVVDEALVDVAELLGLVLPRAAVVLPVAQGLQRDAHRAVASAVELHGGVAAQGGVACKRKKNQITIFPNMLTSFQ